MEKLIDVINYLWKCTFEIAWFVSTERPAAGNYIKKCVFCLLLLGLFKPFWLGDKENQTSHWKPTDFIDIQLKWQIGKSWDSIYLFRHSHLTQNSDHGQMCHSFETNSIRVQLEIVVIVSKFAIYRQIKPKNIFFYLNQNAIMKLWRNYY